MQTRNTCMGKVVFLKRQNLDPAVALMYLFNVTVLLALVTVGTDFYPLYFKGPIF